ASRLRSHRFAPAQAELAEAAARERATIIAAWGALEPARRPRAWLTYHPYYKAPDLIGPEIAARFSIPYVTAEASYAGKRDRDDWAGMQRTVKAAVRAAALNICFTAEDREGLERLVALERIADLAPFIDAEPIHATRGNPSDTVRLITVAMMRSGAKLASYEMLARALARILDLPWTLDIVGDGPERPAVTAAFAKVPVDRLHWAGELDASAVAARLAAADVFVWPGTNEAYGMAYLEAQAAGLPVVAQATAGVPTVVRHGATGLLTPPGDDAAYSGAITRLITDQPLRHRLGHAARKFVTEERSLPAAATRLRRLLTPLLAPAPAGTP
ncbi:MAG TPA: glycosyltransferase family 4 protein, partial [Aestuariivirgaceae bacterium]|nr:glycosyltransferase family 4 protein [Aestuariivirgaceae bacterium]